MYDMYDHCLMMEASLSPRHVELLLTGTEPVTFTYWNNTWWNLPVPLYLRGRLGVPPPYRRTFIFWHSYCHTDTMSPLFLFPGILNIYVSNFVAILLTDVWLSQTINKYMTQRGSIISSWCLFDSERSYDILVDAFFRPLFHYHGQNVDDGRE